MKLREIVELANVLDQIATAKTFEYEFLDDGIVVIVTNANEETYTGLFALDKLKKGV